MARIGRKALCATLFAGLATPLLAQRVPLPTARPVAVAAAQPAAAGGAPTAQPQAADHGSQKPPAMIPTNPFAALLGTPGTTTALTPEQRATINRVNKYLSTTQVLSGDFVQVGPDGSKTTGKFFISKPGKVRFEYDAPSPIDIVADGQSVVVRDRNLATQDVYPLSQTPLRFLLSDHVDLLKDTNLVALYSDDVFVTVVVEEKNGLVGTSRLMIMFSAKDMQIKQWTVTDPQGYDTTVAVYNLDTTKRPDPNLFKIDYTRYHN
ncbi:MAG TPA: outer membrane lipoprotein carrier protein LolA [Pseudolabrys sp.]|jgi:outer membrane lipoprotein-sorting protein|nr:outer membrane lipoprotein carrier protein LolA [Pseudolabrys sp.]